MSTSLEAVLLDHSSGILLLVEPASLAICAASEPTLRLLGYRREDLIGHPISAIECGLTDVVFWKEVLQGGSASARNVPSIYLCANGDLVLATKSVERVTSEARDWLVVRAETQSSPQRIEDDLVSMVSLLRATLEATGEGILLVDRSGAIVNMNQRFSRLWDLPAELLVEHDDDAIFRFMAARFSDPAAYLARLGAIAPDADAEAFDLLQLADGRIFERKSMPARHGVRILGRVFSFTDITERQRMEEALRASEERLRSAFDVSPDAININRLEDGTYVSVNNGFCRIMGYGRAEIVGCTSLERNIWDDREDRRKMVRGLLEAGVVENLEARFRAKNGDIKIGLMSAALIRLDGVPHVISVTRDITEQKLAERARAQLEMQLREAQKMEALGTLAGGIAHDFNNIIAAIMGNAELARTDLGSGHVTEESLAEIVKASHRAKALVRQILTFGRRQLLERDVIALAPVIEESVLLLRAALPAGVSLSVECAADAPAVLADATQIEQVLLNLCSNAWQMMEGQARPGRIELRLDAHQAAGGVYTGPEQRSRGGRVALPAGRYARLTVRDNGPGMEEAIRERIFEPFFTTKPAGKGTGLGLAVVHGIVKGHEGSIEVQSARGEGTTFCIYLPEAAAPATVASAHAPAAVPAHGGGRHIVCIDDDEAIVFLMQRLLERQGYRVSGYVDPFEALAAMRAAPDEFDLVVTDYNMPGMSGLEVARELHQIRSDLPVALASGYITEELRAQALAAGLVELIYKPNTADDLCAAVARLAQARR